MTTSIRARLGALLSLSMLLVLAACGGSAGSESAGDGDGSSGGGTVAVTDGVVQLTADNLEFDASTIEAPADTPFTISFTNLEAVPHNVAVYTEEGGEEIVIGEIVSEEGGTADVSVEALAAGTYYFRCDVHPEMEGTIVVG
jgi:plastocyanin